MTNSSDCKCNARYYFNVKFEQMNKCLIGCYVDALWGPRDSLLEYVRQTSTVVCQCLRPE